MKYILATLVLCILLPPPATTAATGGFDRYQVILDRKPFGDPPLAPEAPPPPPGPAAPPWAESYRLVSVTKIEGGDIKVGILDRKSNKPLVLRVGEIQDGIELLNASVEEESADLRKDGETVTMNLQEANPGERPRPQQQAANPQNPPSRPTAARGQPRPSAPQQATPPSAVPAPRGIIRNRVPSPPGR